MPTPASADIRCSTVEMLAPAALSVDDKRVSPTFAASAGNGDRLRQIGAIEHDAGIRRRGPQAEVDARAGMQADARRLDRSL